MSSGGGCGCGGRCGQTTPRPGTACCGSTLPESPQAAPKLSASKQASGIWFDSYDRYAAATWIRQVTLQQTLRPRHSDVDVRALAAEHGSQLWTDWRTSDKPLPATRQVTRADLRAPPPPPAVGDPLPGTGLTKAQPPDARPSLLPDPLSGLPLGCQPRAIDPSGTEGLNAYRGEKLNAGHRRWCGWEWGGYALPLLDPKANKLWFDQCTDGSQEWSNSLDHHVTTTSTTTVYIRELCRWRIYFPPNGLIPDSGGLEGTPLQHPQDTAGTSIKYPDESEWQAGPFNPNYFAYVDSPDGGLHFPVYAPKVAPRDPSKCSGWQVDWTGAGWSSTGVQANTTGPDEDGWYVTYQDITVLDFKAEFGLYVMIAVECSSRTPVTSGVRNRACCVPECATCKVTIIDGTGSQLALPMPRTRLVAFLSRSPDFSGPAVVPQPGRRADGLVLLEPGNALSLPSATGVLTGACPNEWYGVPHAVVAEGRSQAILFVPWQGVAGNEPAPLKTRYGYRNDGVAGPMWMEGMGGVSVFSLSMAVLRTAFDRLRSLGNLLSTLARDAVANGVERAYQGELLVTQSGSVNERGGFKVPVAWPKMTDPQFAWVDGGLRVYWDQVHLGGDGDSDTDTLFHADHRDVDDYVEALGEAGDDIATSMASNGRYTLFVLPPKCALDFDARTVFRKAPSDGTMLGKLVADPDVVQLDDGTLRASFFCAPPGTSGDGLAFAIMERNRHVHASWSHPDPDTDWL